MKHYVKIFPIKDGYKAVENVINEYLRENQTSKIVSISALGEHHVIVVFEKLAVNSFGVYGERR